MRNYSPQIGHWQYIKNDSIKVQDSKPIRLLGLLKSSMGEVVLTGTQTTKGNYITKTNKQKRKKEMKEKKKKEKYPSMGNNL